MDPMICIPVEGKLRILMILKMDGCGQMLGLNMSEKYIFLLSLPNYNLAK